MTKYFIIFLLLFIYSANTSAQYPAAVQKNLQLAGTNRKELEKAIVYFKKQQDPQKLQAIYFLIGNMHNHFGVDYYWVDEQNKRIPFNELQYKDEAAAKLALEQLRKKHPKMRTVQFTRKDLESLSGNELINNVNAAFKQWKQSPYRGISFNDFCEYILPYRVNIEPYQPWRSYYGQTYQWVAQKMKANGINDMLRIHASMFAGLWGQQRRTEPLPRLGAQQLNFRKNGMCEDGAAFTLFSMRSQGIPSVQNIIPYWATAKGGHFFATIYDNKMNPINYERSTNRKFDRGLSREPGKVLRATYAEQSNTLASFTDTKKIPSGILRSKTYKDVTADYWPTANISAKITTSSPSEKIVYACVFNGLRWRAIWWSKNINNSFTFTNMSKGVVYLPSYYVNDKLVQASYPIALGYNNQQQLIPNKSRRQPIIIKEEEGYLLFKPGTYYRLYYWDTKWVLAQRQQAKGMMNQMIFNNVPSNALYLLLPEKPIGKERPFIITNNQQRVWF